MSRRLLGFVLLYAALGCAAYAQDPQLPQQPAQSPAAQQTQNAPPAPDAKTVLAAMAQALGGQDVKTIRYSGSGFTFAFGQSYSPTEEWPRFRLERYERQVDYQNVSSQEVLVSTQAESPARGGGNLIGVREQVFGVSGPYAWNQTATLPAIPLAGASLLPLATNNPPVPAPDEAANRSLFIWLTPQGFLKVAATHEITLHTETVRRKTVISISFKLENGVEVEGFLNDGNLLDRVTTHIPNPVLGDMLVDVAYLSYKTFDGVQFPTQILVQEGGFHTLEVSVSSVAINSPDFKVEVPAEARVKTAPEAPVVAQSLDQGLWFVTAGASNSVVVEFRDFVVVIEAPENEERAIAVINKVKELVPNKAIRYLINTHHHFEHVGGLRTFAAEGATIVTHGLNRDFYGLMFTADRNLKPDRFSQGNRQPKMELVGNYYEIENGSRVLEVHHVRDSLHDAGLLMVYLPHEHLLVESDVFIPPGEGMTETATINPFTENLYDNIMRLKLEVTRIAPIEGHVVPWSELLKAVGKPADESPAPDLIRASARVPRAAL